MMRCQRGSEGGPRGVLVAPYVCSEGGPHGVYPHGAMIKMQTHGYILLHPPGDYLLVIAKGEKWYGRGASAYVPSAFASYGVIKRRDVMLLAAESQHYIELRRENNKEMITSPSHSD